MRSRFFALAIAVVLTAGVAAAEPSAANRVTARALLDEGYALLAKHDASAALAKFTAADAIMNVPSTKLAMAESHVALGQLVEAQDDLNAALRMPEPASESRGLRKAREDCAKLLAETAPRVAELTFTLSGDATAQVRVDGAVVPPAALTAARRLNPGTHEVVVAGMSPQTVTLAEGERKTIALAMPAPKKEVAAPPVLVAPPPPPERPSRVPWEIGGLAVGGAGIVFGAVSGFVALGSKSSAEAAGCVDNRCPPPAHSDVDSAKQWATISTVGFAVGVVGLAVAAVAYAWPQKP
jgi:hypothetical protein